ncbi:MAG: helix-turn-helix transcriptional regulator [Flavobacteriaceae bacterium]
MNLSKKEEEFIKNLGKHIVVLRKEKKLKQIDLATKINIEDSALRRIESGRTNPTIKTLLRIAQGVEVEFTELFNFPTNNG